MLQTGLGPDCPVFGGIPGMLPSEPTDFLQLHGREILKDGLPILLITGPVKYRFRKARSFSRGVENQRTISPWLLSK